MFDINNDMFQLNNNGQLIRIIPSLTGSLYKFDGQNIDSIPINADNLLKSSFLYSDDLVLAGKYFNKTILASIFIIFLFRWQRTKNLWSRV